MRPNPIFRECAEYMKSIARRNMGGQLVFCWAGSLCESFSQRSITPSAEKKEPLDKQAARARCSDGLICESCGFCSLRSMILVRFLPLPVISSSHGIFLHGGVIMILPPCHRMGALLPWPKNSEKLSDDMIPVRGLRPVARAERRLFTEPAKRPERRPSPGSQPEVAQKSKTARTGR